MFLFNKFNRFIFLFFVIFFFIKTAFAETYFPLEKSSGIKSVTIQDKSAVIKMADYNVKFPIIIMNGTDYKRANGITPKGMKIGLKYNQILLRLVAIDKKEQNYMVADFVTKNSSTKILNLPDNYKKPITKNDIYISSEQFIQSYPLWSANSVTRGFDLLASKEKGIIALFPAIQLELADKLCRADTVTAGIFELLSEQHKTTCDDLSVFNQESRYKKLTALANQERPLLVKILECSQGNRNPKLCQKISQQLAEKTLQSVTLRSLLKTM